MSIATALFSESQSRLYRWLFGEPSRSFHLSELRRLTGLGSASVQRELRKLVEARLVSSGYVGNQRRFQANPQSSVFRELVSITRKTLGIQSLLANALAPLQARIRAAWIYPSVANGNDTAMSDIDLMIVGDGLTLGELVEQLTPLEAEIGRKINPTCYTPDEFSRRRSEPESFINRVLAQPILPLIGGPDDLAAAR
jgi:predicted nucleotidyltransferase